MDIYIFRKVYFFSKVAGGEHVVRMGPRSDLNHLGARKQRMEQGGNDIAEKGFLHILLNFYTFYPILHIWPNFAHFTQFCTFGNGDEQKFAQMTFHLNIWRKSPWQLLAISALHVRGVELSADGFIGSLEGFWKLSFEKMWKLWKYNHLHLLWIQVQSNPSPHFIFKWNEETSRQFNKRRQFDKITPT